MNSANSQENWQAGTVLIVDDDLNEMLSAHRVIATTCPQLWVRNVRSGQDLIRYLQGEGEFADRIDFPYPVLILLDLRMAGMQGFDVLRWLAAHPPHNLIPVVVFTASGDWQLAQQAYSLGARSFLSKPLRANEFKDTIAVIDQWARGAASSA